MASGNAHLLVFLDGIDGDTRTIHWAEQGCALALLRVGQMREAVASIMMDMRKYPNCEVPHEIHAIGIFAAAAGDAAVARAYIEGFN